MKLTGPSKNNRKPFVKWLELELVGYTIPSKQSQAQLYIYIYIMSSKHACLKKMQKQDNGSTKSMSDSTNIKMNYILPNQTKFT